MYHLTNEDLQGTAERSDDFRPDPELPVGKRAELIDYKNSGYDRGHMAPAADFTRSDSAMSETFLLSNMTPQRSHLNRGVWEHLEEQVRTFTQNRGSIWIVTGSLFIDESGRRCGPFAWIGPDSVAVPTHFFKAILSELASGTHEMFAFILPNWSSGLSDPTRNYLVSVDSVGKVSGLDLFDALPDSEEAGLEAKVAVEWLVQ